MTSFLVDVANVFCHRCGVYDASLRHSEHPRVVSNLVAANRSTRVGIWCARCRGIEAAKATAVSLLAGWWSLRGPALTVAAIRANLAGGEQQPTANARMLRAIALHEYDASNYDFAAMFAGAAHAVQPQRENSRLLQELHRAGHRDVVSFSPWRFAAWAPVAAAALVVVIAGWAMLPRGKGAAAAPGPVRHASIAPIEAAATTTAEQWNASAGADELEKLLTPASSDRLARAYVNARVREIGAELPSRVRRGDEIASQERALLRFNDYPAVMRLLGKPGAAEAYAKLTAAFADATRYYRVGAPVESIERTAGESLKVTADLALGAVEADLRGHTERSDALGAQVDARIDAIYEMKRELRIRGAVIGILGKAISDFAGAVH